MKKRNVIFVVMAAFIFVGSVVACNHGRRCGGFDEFDLAAATDRIASRLDLTASQQADLEQIAGEIAEKAKAMHADRENRLQALAGLVRQDAIGRDVVDGMIADKIEMLKEIAEYSAQRLIAFHGTLTPEQREMIASRIESRSSDDCRFGMR